MAWQWSIDARWQLLAEAMDLQSTRAARADLGIEPKQRERLLQIALRFIW